MASVDSVARAPRGVSWMTAGLAVAVTAVAVSVGAWGLCAIRRPHRTPADAAGAAITPHIVVVLDWFEELRERLAASAR